MLIGVDGDADLEVDRGVGVTVLVVRLCVAVELTARDEALEGIMNTRRINLGRVYFGGLSITQRIRRLAARTVGQHFLLSCNRC